MDVYYIYIHIDETPWRGDGASVSRCWHCRGSLWARVCRGAGLTMGLAVGNDRFEKHVGAFIVTTFQHIVRSYYHIDMVYFFCWFGQLHRGTLLAHALDKSVNWYCMVHGFIRHTTSVEATKHNSPGQSCVFSFTRQTTAQTTRLEPTRVKSHLITKHSCN